MATDAGDSRTIGSMMEEHTLLDGGCGGGASLRAMLPSVPPGPARAGLRLDRYASIPGAHSMSPSASDADEAAPPAAGGAGIAELDRETPQQDFRGGTDGTSVCVPARSAGAAPTWYVLMSTDSDDSCDDAAAISAEHKADGTWLH